MDTTDGWEMNGWNDDSSDDCRKLAGMVQTWLGVVVCSMDEQQWPEKLGYRQSTTAYDITEAQANFSSVFCFAD